MNGFPSPPVPHRWLLLVKSNDYSVTIGTLIAGSNPPRERFGYILQFPSYVTMIRQYSCEKNSTRLTKNPYSQKLTNEKNLDSFSSFCFFSPTLQNNFYKKI